MDGSDPAIFKEAGCDAFMKYRYHKSGIELFRAYIERRTADSQRNTEKEQQIIERMNNPSGNPPDEYEEMTLELLRLHILKELDPIIKDLLTFCQKPPLDKDDQLPNLRSALRIGRGHTPSDSSRVEKQWEIERLWIKAYRDMETTRIYRSEEQILAEIAKAAGVGKTTALSCWRSLKEREPQQLKFSENIARIAIIVMRNKRAKALSAKFPEGGQRKRITFGKKYSI